MDWRDREFSGARAWFNGVSRSGGICVMVGAIGTSETTQEQKIQLFGWDGVSLRRRCGVGKRSSWKR